MKKKIRITMVKRIKKDYKRNSQDTPSVALLLSLNCLKTTLLGLERTLVLSKTRSSLAIDEYGTEP